MVRLLRTGKNIPTDLRNYATQVPDIGNSLCAVVEFDNSAAAMSAVRVIKSRNKDFADEETVLNEENHKALLEKLKGINCHHDL